MFRPDFDRRILRLDRGRVGVDLDAQRFERLDIAIGEAFAVPDAADAGISPALGRVRQFFAAALPDMASE